MEIQRFESGTPWEPVVGYSRAVRCGPLVEVSGTTATSEDGVILGGEDVSVQAREAFANVVRALELAGAAPADVVRTRMYVTDISRWQDVARAHAEVFGDVRPATAMVEVSALLDPRMLVEVEATAWVAGDG
jgi:enamine deaminase RidA (YjgF/YER057c/UK114 family)